MNRLTKYDINFITNMIHPTEPKMFLLLGLDFKVNGLCLAVMRHNVVATKNVTNLQLEL